MNNRALNRWASYVSIGVVSFLLGSTARPMASMNTVANPDPSRQPVKVTGIGGVFFKSTDPNALRDWYRTHLGIDAADWGGFAFKWNEPEQTDQTGYTVWGVFPDSTNYFSPGDEPYMLNYRVADLTTLLEALRREGVEIVGEIEQHPNGKFAWIVDLEGRKVELWEPVPSSEDPYLN